MLGGVRHTPEQRVAIREEWTSTRESAAAIADTHSIATHWPCCPAGA